MKPKRIVYFDFRPHQPVVAILRVPGKRRSYEDVSVSSFDRLVRVCTIDSRFGTQPNGVNQYVAIER